MSARAIPERLEPDVVAKHREGLSLRAISDWLRETHAVKASREAVSGVLHRNGISAVSLAESELARAVAPRTEEVVENLVECMKAYRELRDEPYTPDTKQRIHAQLRILKEWSRIALSLLRGAPRRIRAAIAALKTPEAPPAKEATATVAAPTPPVPTPPRNRPCPCGSGKKWKVCCERTRTAPLATAVSG